MSQKALFDKVSLTASRMTAHAYSTSFSVGIQCLEKGLRDPIYSIYGFVRFADEIVDTFHDYDKKTLLKRFKEDTWIAIEEKISLNPILNSFQATVNKFFIERELIEQFLKSMEVDLHKTRFDQEEFEKYILGSSEAVGLMCLRVFCGRDLEQYNKLKPAAMKLGSAFQKINFLRDLQVDYSSLGRIYFPGLDMKTFDDEDKKNIEESIAADLHTGYAGIKRLPRGARLGVYVAYLYYKALFGKIRNVSSQRVVSGRLQLHNRHKLAILGYSFVKHQLNLI